MNAQIEKARSLGYSDAEIADYLVPKDKLALARKHNYSDADILAKFAGEATPAEPAPATAATEAPYRGEMFRRLEAHDPVQAMRDTAGGVLNTLSGEGNALGGIGAKILGLDFDSGAAQARNTQFIKEQGMNPNSLPGLIGSIGTGAAATGGLTGGFNPALTLGSNMLRGFVGGFTGSAMLDATNNPMNALIGGGLGGTMPLLVNGAQGVKNWLGDGTSFANDILRRAFVGDKVKMAEAVALAKQGLTAEQIAAKMDNPLFASVVNDARRLKGESGEAVTLRSRAQLTAEQRGMANKLASAEGFVAPVLTQAESAAARTGAALPNAPASSAGAAIRAAGLSEKEAMRANLIRPAYNEAFKLAGDTPNIDATPLVKQAKAILGDNFLDPSANPSQVALAIGRLKPTTTTAKAVPGSWGQDVMTAGPPMTTLKDIDTLHSAINADIAAARAAGDEPKALLLGKLHDSIEESIAASGSLADEAKSAYASAVNTYKTEFVPRFKTGQQANVLGKRTNSQARVVDENVLDAFFKPGAETETANLIRMVGDKGKPAVAEAVKKKFRDAVVTADGVINDKAVTKFLDDYDVQIKQLEDAGVLSRSDLSSAGVLAKSAKQTVDKFANTSKTIADLRRQVTESPANTAAAKTLAEAEAAIAEVQALLKDKERFQSLLAHGRGAGPSLSPTPPQNKAPVGIQTEIVVNQITKLLGRRVNDKVAKLLGNELLDSGALAAAIERASKGRESSITGRAVNALAPAALNALRSQ